MPNPTQHVAVTLPLIAALPPHLRLAAFGGGVLIDADHLLDALMHRWGVMKHWPGQAEHYTFIPLHGLDVLAVVALVAVWRKCPTLGALALGMALHHAMDFAVDRNWVKVSLLWRARRRFYAPRVRRYWEKRSPLTWL